VAEAAEELCFDSVWATEHIIVARRPAQAARSATRLEQLLECSPGRVEGKTLSIEERAP
jgi:hypothetical protein